MSFPDLTAPFSFMKGWTNDMGWDKRDAFTARFSSYDKFAKPYDLGTSQCFSCKRCIFRRMFFPHLSLQVSVEDEQTVCFGIKSLVSLVSNYLNPKEKCRRVIFWKLLCWNGMQHELSCLFEFFCKVDRIMINFHWCVAHRDLAALRKICKLLEWRGSLAHHHFSGSSNAFCTFHYI